MADSSSSSSNYYGPHTTQLDYNKAFQEAVSWAQTNEGEDETPTTIARIYHIKEPSI